MSILTAHLETLLWEDESTTLDFKTTQYPLTTDEEKSELLKDLLAFANTTRTKDAHILLGVEQNPGKRATIHGVTHHLNDANLQQLVNSKTNRPLTFTYHALTIDNQPVGLLRIPRQQRPIFLRKNFGKLQANTVYVRHGSSTSTATPDELTNLRTRKPRKARQPTVQALALTVMHHHHEIITMRGGRGIPGFAYDPPQRHTFSLGEYVRLDAKLLITPTTPLVIVSDLSNATITTADNKTIQLDHITFEENAETIDVTTARVTRIKSQQRVTTDPLQASRTKGITITITLASATGDTLRTNETLTWNQRRQAFTNEHA